MRYVPKGRPAMLSPETANKLRQIIQDYDRGLLKNPPRIPGGGRKPSPSPFRTFRITGSSGSPKVYTGRIQTRPKGGAGYGQWADDPNDETEYDLYFHPEEAEAGSTALQTNDYVEAVRKPVSGEEPEWWIVSEGAGTANDPLDLTYEDEHEENALSDAGWDRGDQEAGDGVIISLVTGIAYHADGDEKLYEFRRDFTYDSRGMLRTIGEEYRVEIDSPEVCGEEEP